MRGKRLRRLSLSVGDFIRYWGFRRIHGAIWTQLYLSSVPLSCADLTDRLGLSKALISPALGELCKYGLISDAPAPNEKTKVYLATENITDVVQRVLKNREAKMLKRIVSDFSSFELTDASSADLNPTRIKALGEMIASAYLILESILDNGDESSLPYD
ncbi:MAG: hypothetical protein K2X47_07475, partial [Bdellovibrionales bacterium]|nr:hypothetical protein [Bdellovibrionales bacterium]